MTRLVLAVAGTMAVVLLGSSALVFWRVGYALNRQLDQDLIAYARVVDRVVSTGSTPPVGTPGQSYEVYDPRGRLIDGNARTRLADADTVARAVEGEIRRWDVGTLLPATDHPYRVVTRGVSTPEGPVVVATAISRNKRDEALRELLLQLALADLVTLIAASLVGYGVARGALKPVERYRLAAELADDAPVLPVEERRDDEISRLGHTFNALLGRISQANERERQFLADTSHELRSPLAVMRAELEVALLRPRGETETRLALESLRDQVERLIAISAALLDLEELGVSGQQAPGEEVDLEELLTDVARRYAVPAAAAAREIVTRAETTEGPARLVGNRHWLDLAVGNLVTNALRYGQGTISLSATQDEDRTRLVVSDEGPGFAPEFVDKAFDRFTRADVSRTTRGVGLGLALVRAVADAHRGTASISGSSVIIALPTRSTSA